MPYCPKCGYEYNQNVEKCPDCDEQLVDSPPLPDDSDESNDADEGELVLFYATPDMVQMEMLKGALENEDITVLVKRGTGVHAQFGALLPGSHNLFKMWVTDKNLQKALEIKEQVIGSEEE
ncbi:MAG: hypothetical protein GF307_11010 [candidate division Zixibacteria bacterium]|nr:hypothetical protein [candidate division Zixibacteria bacterium]